MSGAGTITRPVPMGLPSGVGTGARVGAGAGGLAGLLSEILRLTTADATRASEAARTGECSSGDKWDGSGDCNSCHPKKGSKRVINRGLTVEQKGEGSWWEYQLRVANLYAAPNVFRVVAPTIEEWNYKGVDFDGFWEKACTLVEAKGNYSFVFKINKAAADKQDAVWVAEARRQFEAAMPMPPARLAWYFMQNDACQRANGIFLNIPLPIPCIYMP